MRTLADQESFPIELQVAFFWSVLRYFSQYLENPYLFRYLKDDLGEIKREDRRLLSCPNIDIVDKQKMKIKLARTNDFYRKLLCLTDFSEENFAFSLMHSTWMEWQRSSAYISATKAKRRGSLFKLFHAYFNVHRKDRKSIRLFPLSSPAQFILRMLMLYYTLLLLSMQSWIVSIRFGKSVQTQLVAVNSTTLWLGNQSSWSECMCEALRFASPSIVAFNYFSNGSCQLTTSDFSVSTAFYLVVASNSTAFFLSETVIDRLTSICCADLQWLMTQIQQPLTFNTTSTTQPVGLALDTDFPAFALTYGTPSVSLQRRDLTKSMTGRTTLFVKGHSQPISYHQGFYYVGINPPPTKWTLSSLCL